MQVRLPSFPSSLPDHPESDHVQLQVNDETGLAKLANLLNAADPPVPHHLWVEQPENEPTCLVLAPNRKEKNVKKALDKAGARLWKA